jgi:uncharacterized membrane protein
MLSEHKITLPFTKKQLPPWLYLILIIILAFLLRLPAIGRDSLWYDEAISYIVARLPLTAILNNISRDPHPPFYYSLLHLWYTILPNSDVSGRLMGTLLNLLLIPLIYGLTKDLFHRIKPALLAAFFVAISPFHILYSHELRMYTLLMLLATATVFTFLRAFHRNQKLWWILFGLCAWLMIYTHLFSIFILIAIALYALRHRQQRRAFLITIAIGCLLFLLFLPWIIILLGEANIGSGSFRPLAIDRAIALNPIIPLTTLAFLVFGQAFAIWYVAIILFLTLANGAILLLEIRKAYREESPPPLLLPGLIILCAIGLPCLFYYIRPFFLPERTMAVASPFLLILLSWAVSRRHSPLPYLVGLTAVFMLVGSFLYLTGSPLKPPYRTAIQFVAEQRQPNDVVLHTSDSSYLPSLAYVNFPQHAFLSGDPDIRKPEPILKALGLNLWHREQATATAERLWLIVAIEHSQQWQLEQVALFDNSFSQIETHDFGGIAIILYDLTEQN